VRVVHVGLGDFGLWWCNVLYERMKERKDIELIAIVDRDKDTHKHVSEYDVPCYTDLADALEAGKPDFVLNSTPPYAHMAVNRVAFSHNIPVLMEKPISEDFEEVLECLEFADNGQKLMIAESYRHFIHTIFVKEQLAKHLHNLSSVNMVFRRHHKEAGKYHFDMEHPTLIDISIHHFDLLRFLTGKEVWKLSAQLNTPEWSWYKGVSNVKVIAEMDDNVQFCYDASMDSYGETSWIGNWTFTAENGVARLIDDKLHFHMEDSCFSLDLPQEDEVADKHRMLDAFMAYIRGGPVPQTDIQDQVKNAAIAEATIQAAKKGCAVEVRLR